MVTMLATELATDIYVAVGDVKFYLHKFSRLSVPAFRYNLIDSTFFGARMNGVSERPERRRRDRRMIIIMKTMRNMTTLQNTVTMEDQVEEQLQVLPPVVLMILF